MKLLTAHSAVLIAAATLLSVTSYCDGVTVIDMSYPLKEGENIAWPIFPKYNFTIFTRGHSKTFNTWLESNRFEILEHTGTHMDAPAHTEKGRWRMHQVPVSRLVGPGVVVNVAEMAKENSKYRMTVNDLKNWESENGRIPAGAVLLMNSGWGDRYPLKSRVFNSDRMHDPYSYSFPSMSPEAATWLANERDVIAVGTDTPSPDLLKRGRDPIPVHKTFLAKDILILENVANVDKIPAKGTTIVIGAINIHDGSGAPMRVLALKDMDCGCNGGWTLQGSSLSLAVVILSCLVWFSPVI